MSNHPNVGIYGIHGVSGKDEYLSTVFHKRVKGRMYRTLSKEGKTHFGPSERLANASNALKTHLAKELSQIPTVASSQ